jgi:hypothetical protein
MSDSRFGREGAMNLDVRFCPVFHSHFIPVRDIVAWCGSACRRCRFLFVGFASALMPGRDIFDHKEHDHGRLET